MKGGSPTSTESKPARTKPYAAGEAGPRLRSVLDDLEDVALLLFAAGRRHDRADRRSVRAALPDHLAQIFLGHPELEHVGVLPDDLFDLDLLRLVDEGLDD